jgi:hypothetical protein
MEHPMQSTRRSSRVRAVSGEDANRSASRVEGERGGYSMAGLVSAAFGDGAIEDVEIVIAFDHQECRQAALEA